MKNDKDIDNRENEDYQAYIERLSAPPAPIKISEEQLEELLLETRKIQSE